METGELTVGFRRKRAPSVEPSAEGHEAEAEPNDTQAPEAEAETNHGTPISSPMTGIYYASPSPGSPPFVKVGDAVVAGQVVGLIETMKVFNEINSPLSGTVTRVVASSGDIVQPGDPLLFVG